MTLPHAALAVLYAALVPVDDAAFSVAVESFVRDTRRARTFADVLPPRQARLLANLACGHFSCREEAERSIRELGPANLKLLLWGSWAKDREVASRCERMLAERPERRCPHCGGSGVCPSRRDNGYCSPCIYLPGDRYNADRPEECLHCMGTGDSRPARPGD